MSLSAEPATEAWAAWSAVGQCAAEARRYLDHSRARLPPARRLIDARLAVSEEHDAPEVLVAFRLRPEPAILVTVAMAYGGLDAPKVAVSL